MSAGADLLGVTEETFNAIKGTLTTGLTASTGLQGVNLQDYVSLVPCKTPTRDSLPRVAAPQGAQFAYWRTFLNVNALQADGAEPTDFGGSATEMDLQNVFAPFGLIAKHGIVTDDAIALAGGYADALAVQTLETMKQEFITENVNVLHSQAFAVPTLGTISLSTSATNGYIGSGATVYVWVAARSGKNYFYGGSGPASASSHTSVGTTSTTNSVSAFIPAVRTAAAWDWFVGSSSSNGVYYTTTTVNSVTITTIPTTAQAVPSLPLISSVQPTTPPTADTSYQSYWINGYVASILGDWSTGAFGSSYVTPGQGTAQGSIFTSLDGGQFHVDGAAILELDELNLAIYNNYPGVSPARFIVGTQIVNDLANAALSSPQAILFYQGALEDRQKLVMGGTVANYLNKTDGQTQIEIFVDPYMVPGELIAEVRAVPFMGSNVKTASRVETLRDYQRFDYFPNYVANSSAGGPRHEFDVRCFEAFETVVGPTMAVLANIAPGLAS
jgi:hypothetical protein